jgi:riboflavin synthase
MFTGIVESLGRIEKMEHVNGNIALWISCSFLDELKIDQSIAHNGICLTVDTISDTQYRVTAIAETIQKTAISNYRVGDVLNLERCLTLSQRIDGHIVQGHIDTTGAIEHVAKLEGSWNYRITVDDEYEELIIEKGSVAMDGISLTCHSLNKTSFEVSIIPYTFEHTNAHTWSVGTKVNIEFDIIGKYLQRRHLINAEKG